MEMILIALLVVGVGCWLTGRYFWNRVIKVRDAIDDWSKEWYR